MHYCVLVLTKEFPTDEVIEKAMEPFDEDKFYKKQEEDPTTPKPVFQWDFWKLGGRYGALLKIDVSEDKFDKYELKFYAKETRSKRLFRSAILEAANFGTLGIGARFTEENALCYMGTRDSVIYADAAKIEDCIATPGGWAIVLPNGEAYARETWDGDNWIKNPSFDELKDAAIAANKDCWISVIDIHD